MRLLIKLMAYQSRLKNLTLQPDKRLQVSPSFCFTLSNYYNPSNNCYYAPSFDPVTDLWKTDGNF